MMTILAGAGVGLGDFSEVRGKADSLDKWRAELDGAVAIPFQRVESEDPARCARFEGNFRRNLMGQVSTQLTDVTTAGRHAISRSSEHILATPEPHYIAFFQFKGSSTFCQEGARARLRPGDYVIATTQVPYRWELDAGRHSVFSLRFPQSLIDIPEQVIRPFTGQSLSPSDGFGRYLAPFVSAVAQDDGLLCGPVGARIARNMVDMFATGMAELIERAPGGRSAPMFFRATQYIADNLADPELDASRVAAGCYISTRSLQALFHEQGTTVTDWIRHRRLTACHRDLADPALLASSIGEIAHRWGYPDQAYFARLFRRAFGESPREWRTRSVAAERLL